MRLKLSKLKQFTRIQNGISTSNQEVRTASDLYPASDYGEQALARQYVLACGTSLALPGSDLGPSLSL